MRENVKLYDYAWYKFYIKFSWLYLVRKIIQVEFELPGLCFEFRLLRFLHMFMAFRTCELRINW